jgi:hypothetical protein
VALVTDQPPVGGNHVMPTNVVPSNSRSVSSA